MFCTLVFLKINIGMSFSVHVVIDIVLLFSATFDEDSAGRDRGL